MNREIEYDITRIPSVDCRELRMRSAYMMHLSKVYNRLTAMCLTLSVLGCAGFFVVTLLGHDHEVWMFSVSFALILVALLCKAAEAVYLNKYNALRDHLAADVIDWINKLKESE